MAETKVLSIQERTKTPPSIKKTEKGEKKKVITPDNPTTKMVVDTIIISLTIVAVTWDLALFIGEKFSDLVGSNWCQIAFLGVAVIYLVGWRNKKDQIQAAATICKWVVLPLAIIMLFVNSLWPGTTLKGLKVKWEQHKAAQAQAAAARQRPAVKQPDYKIYPPGTYYFNLKAGEMTDHWIMFPNGRISKYSLSSTKGLFILKFDDGTIAKSWEPTPWPNKRKIKFKIMAVKTDQVVILYVK